MNDARKTCSDRRLSLAVVGTRMKPRSSGSRRSLCPIFHLTKQPAQYGAGVHTIDSDVKILIQISDLPFAVHVTPAKVVNL